jgi:hypothetical protein
VVRYDEHFVDIILAEAFNVHWAAEFVSVVETVAVYASECDVLVIAPLEEAIDFVFCVPLQVICNHSDRILNDEVASSEKSQACRIVKSVFWDALPIQPLLELFKSAFMFARKIP